MDEERLAAAESIVSGIVGAIAGLQDHRLQEEL